jgi:hypothetical protein
MQHPGPLHRTDAATWSFDQARIRSENGGDEHAAQRMLRDLAARGDRSEERRPVLLRHRAALDFV